MLQGSASREETVQTLLLASRALVGVAARSLAGVDVTLAQFRALVLLATRSAPSVSDLAAALDIHPTTATRLTDRLVRKRLVRRAELPEDRRVTHLHLTARGRRLVNDVTARRARDLAEIVGRMPADNLPDLTRALHEFNVAAGEPDPPFPLGWVVPVG